MKTSGSQFLVIVDFMERYGDLNKPAEGPSGRIRQLQKWAELERVLNMDITGEIKSTEKWKKVWTDLKNNTKRKAARIHKAAIGTGGGAACKLVLSDLELRVLDIVGSQAATGLVEIEEVGAPSPTPVQRISPTSLETEPDVPTIYIEPSPMLRDSTEHSVPLEAGCSGAATPPRAGQGTLSPPPSGNRRRLFRRRSASRRSAPRTSREDAASRHFQTSDERWRKLIRELATDNLRMRQQENQTQVQWQALVSRGLDILEKNVNK